MEFLVEYSVKKRKGSIVVEADDAMDANRQVMDKLFDKYPNETELSVRVLQLD